jgi:hypothetical protein
MSRACRRIAPRSIRCLAIQKKELHLSRDWCPASAALLSKVVGAVCGKGEPTDLCGGARPGALTGRRRHRGSPPLATVTRVGAPGAAPASSAATGQGIDRGAGPGGSPTDRGRAPRRRDHWNPAVNVAANLALRRRIDPVRQLGEAFVDPLREGNPAGDGQRRLDRAELARSLGKFIVALAPPTFPPNPAGVQVLYVTMGRTRQQVIRPPPGRSPEAGRSSCAECAAASPRPSSSRGGALQEFGLPYASDPVVSKHIARFLGRSLQNVKASEKLAAQ